MIEISNFSFHIEQIINQYPINSIERQLLEQMNKSTQAYNYETLDQLQFELSLRKEIVNASVALNSSGLKFSTFYESKCNLEYWDRTNNGGFRLKRGENPHNAIIDIFKNGHKYATECATAIAIIYYGALTKVFSEETFNRLFPSIYLMNWHTLDPLLKEIGAPKRVTDILLGDRCYFNNPDVNPQTPELQGENVIILPNNLYYGHGIGISTSDRIIRILNANRKEGATQSAYFIENSAARPNFKQLYKFR